jgi:hypothetical protein
MTDEAEVEKSFWLSRPDGWVINRKTKKIILLVFLNSNEQVMLQRPTSRICGR